MLNPVDAETHRLLTADEVAEKLSAPRSRVDRLRRAGHLSAVTLGESRSFRFRREDVDRFIEDRLKENDTCRTQS